MCFISAYSFISVLFHRLAYLKQNDDYDVGYAWPIGRTQLYSVIALNAAQSSHSGK